MITRRQLEYLWTGQHQPTRLERWLHTPSRLRDNVVAWVLFVSWLLMAAADTYAPWPLPPFLWAGQGWSMWWLYRQYQARTRPLAQPLPPRQSEKYAIADDLTRHIDDVVAAAEREAIDNGPRPPLGPLSSPYAEYSATLNDWIRRADRVP